MSTDGTNYSTIEPFPFMLKNTLLQIATAFFRLGCIAFGGPAAHIAMMDKEFVQKRQWIERQRFLDLIGATNLIPGPNSTEMTMHVGYEKGGVLGLFIAGICFILPAVTITAILAFIYANYGTLPAIQPIIKGIKPAVLVIIAAAIFKLGKKALKGYELGILGILVLSANLLAVNEIMALLSAGILGAIYFSQKNRTHIQQKALLPFLFLFQLSTINAQLTTTKIFLSFLKVGAILYGSGYVLFAYLEGEFVRTGILSRDLLIDAIAIGQLTPGPVLSTSTFIGYQLGGLQGAIAATVGIFLPSFLFVWFINPLVSQMRKYPFLSYFLDSVNIAAVAVMVAVLFKMGFSTLTNWQAILILSLAALNEFWWKKLDTLWLIVASGLLGWLLYSL